MKIRNYFSAFVLLSIMLVTSPLFAEVWIPDPNLRMAIRETLREEIGLPDYTPLTKEHLKHLTHLEAENSGINDLTGLEHAVSLEQFNADDNQIQDLQPLASLVHLRRLSLHKNRISDVSPLANLTNLENLHLGANRVSDISLLEKLTNLKVLRLNFGENQITDLLPLADLFELEQLDLTANRVFDISPLEKLTNLKVLRLSNNQISDITPLRNLTQLVELSLNDNKIVDITALANLINLVELRLKNNKIVDITALANLINLLNLSLQNNPIRDLSPLLNLPALKYLNIEGILVEDITPFLDLNLIEFRYKALCKFVEFSITPVEERISTRTYPSICQVFGNPIVIEGIPSWELLTEHPELVPYHDLVAHDFVIYRGYLDFYHKDWEGSKCLACENYGLATDILIDVERTKARYDYYHSRNPNFVYLLGWDFRENLAHAFPDDDSYWMLNAEGNRVPGADPDTFIIDFLNPEVQEILIQQAVGIASCGIFDGIVIDQFARNGVGVIHPERAPVSDAELRAALVHIFSEIRNRVPDDFLIMVNAGPEAKNTPLSFTEYINGNFMECGRDPGKLYDIDYLMEIETSLLWAENNLRFPQINCVWGKGIGTEHPNSANNQKWMRVFTTLTMTHSNGYAVYNTGQDGDLKGHYWYDFWDADLGHPVGGAETKAQLYDNRDGIFIREFTNGWAVYNRSGQAQTITLPTKTTGVESGITGIEHIIPDLDGEMYVKVNVADLNGDGIVNIQDLVIVANAFAEKAPDLNGDGIVNIQDLVIVANAFGD